MPVMSTIALGKVTFKIECRLNIYLDSSILESSILEPDSSVCTTIGPTNKKFPSKKYSVKK